MAVETTIVDVRAKFDDLFHDLLDSKLIYKLTITEHKVNGKYTDVTFNFTTDKRC